MNWKEIAKQRYKQKTEIGKQITELKKQIKKLQQTQNAVGYHDFPSVVAELISERYGQVCRTEVIGSGMATHWYLVLYNKNATKKQIQYKRHEVAHTIEIHYSNFSKIEFYTLHYRVIDSSVDTQWHLLPDDIDDVYRLLMEQ